MKIYSLLKASVKITMLFPIIARAEPNLSVEENALLIINQGIGINFEYKTDHILSEGLDIEFFIQKPYDRNRVTAKRKIFSIAPKLRYYFISDKMEGPFIGAKMYFTYAHSSISDSDTTSNYDSFYLAPVVQAGYRFVTNGGFSLSAYIGAGIKSSNNQFPDKDIPASKTNNIDWTNAQSKLNLNVSQFQPDYGFTLGYIF